jgi:hypothetical protein
LEFEAVGVVNEPVQDAVGDSGIADLIVPVPEAFLKWAIVTAKNGPL